MSFSQNLNELFKVRQRFDRTRRPELSARLTTLDAIVSPSTPYASSSYQKLSRSRVYAPGASGPATGCNYGFAYRLAGLGSLMMSCQWSYREHENVPDVFDDLFVQHENSRPDLLPLRRYASGTYQNSRLFSWWTPNDVETMSAADFAGYVGLLTDFLSPYSVILKLSLNHAAVTTFKPSPVDGYDNPAFLATGTDGLDPPQEPGVALDLRRPSTLTFGAKELVVREIAVEKLQFRPIRLQLGTSRVKRRRIAAMAVRIRQFLESELGT